MWDRAVFPKATRFAADVEELEGDILELEPRDKRHREATGVIDMSKTSSRKEPRIAEHADAEYDPSDEYLRPHVAGPKLEALGRPKEHSKEDGRGTLDYDPSYKLVEPSVREVDFMHARGHQPSAKGGDEGDKLILEPNDDLTRKRVTAAVDLHRQTSRTDNTRGKESTKLEYDVDYDARLMHVPGVRLDTGGRPVEVSKSLDVDGLKYDPNYSAVRASAPAAHFTREAGRKKEGEDTEPKEGDILELDPRDDMMHRAVTGVIDMSKTSSRKDGLDDTLTAGCDYHPHSDAVKPRAPGFDFGKLIGQDLGWSIQQGAYYGVCLLHNTQ